MGLFDFIFGKKKDSGLGIIYTVDEQLARKQNIEKERERKRKTRMSLLSDIPDIPGVVLSYEPETFDELRDIMSINSYREYPVQYSIETLQASKPGPPPPSCPKRKR